MLFRVTLVFPITRQFEFLPQLPILQNHQCVMAREHKELRPDPELVERDLRHHGKPPPGGVAFPEIVGFGEDFDEAPVADIDSHPSQLGVGVGGQPGLVKSGGGEEGAVDISEGMERHAVLGEDGKEGIGRIVENGGGEHSARGGDEGRGGTIGPLGGDETVAENTGRDGDVDRRIGVDVNIEKIGGSFGKEALPEGGEVDVGVGEEEEGDFGFGFGIEGEAGEGGFGSDGAGEQGLVVDFIGGGDGDLVVGREEMRGEEEEEREGEEEGEGEHKWGGEHRRRGRGRRGRRR